ncbi:MAG: tetratricopeptide repeat protein [Desulfobacterales bacterium]|nr:tetratricopeptide repeat protein [Desulfobacterales bacterium]
MPKKINRKPDKEGSDKTIKLEMLLLVSCITLFIGFLGGVVFSAYKTTKSPAIKQVSQMSGGFSEQENAVSMLEAVTEKSPENADSWINLGNACFDSGLYTKAIDAYNKALALSPGNADVLTDLGVMYRRSGQPEKAVESFGKAIEINPKHEIARFNQGIVYIHDLKDQNAAIKAWEGLLKINPLAMAPNGQSVDELIKHYKEHE